MPPDDALKAVASSTRDRCRSPLQWSSAPNAGFSPPGVQTWLPVNPNYAMGVNVAAQEGDPNSLLNFYKGVLRLRRSTPALVAGDYRMLHPRSEAYLAFVRQDERTKHTCLVVLNLSSEEQTATFDLGGKQPRLLFSSHTPEDRPLSLEWLVLAPFEVFIAELV